MNIENEQNLLSSYTDDYTKMKILIEEIKEIHRLIEELKVLIAKKPDRFEIVNWNETGR